MDKKLRYITGALGLLIMLYAGYRLRLYVITLNPLGSDKMITVNINDGNENSTLQLSTDKGTLAEFLVEQSDAGMIKLAYEDSTYGMFITGFGLNELVEAGTGEAWVYSSSNNAMCTSDASGYCPAAETLTLEDGDEFTFELIKY